MSTRAQRLREAEALLCAAKHWQNGKPVPWTSRPDDVMPLWGDWEDCDLGYNQWWIQQADICTSAALSEAARLADDELVNEED